jgi:sarcosine oxidase subunit alpha
MPHARTPLHHWHATHGGRFADRGGWQIVAAYSDPQKEVEAARGGLGLADISAFQKISLRGPGVPALAGSLLPSTTAPHVRGVAALPGGTGVACRLAPDHLLLLASPATSTPPGNLLCVEINGSAVVQIDVTSAYAGLWLLGPRLPEVLRCLTHLDLRTAAFPANSCAETSLAGVEALLVRTAELSVPCLRIYVAWDLAEYVWQRLWEAGRDEAITAVGMEALALLGAAPASSSFP